MDPLIAEHLDEIRRIAQRHGATRVRLFGSRARGEARPDSDVDLLIDLEPGRSLMDLASIKVDLEDLLGCEVDVGQYVSRYIHDKVEREAVPL